MLLKGQMVTLAAVVIVALFSGSTAMAEHHAKSGTFHFIQALNTDYTTVKYSEQTITAGSIKGSVTILHFF